MNTPNRSVLVVLGAVVAVAAAGCTDAASSKRAEVQKVIAEAARDLRKATVAAVEPGDARFATVQAALARIPQNLAKVRDGERGQQAAASLLAAAALRELASMRLAQADRLEAENHRQRGLVQGKADAALRLLATTSGHELRSTRDQQQRIDAARREAQERLLEFSQRMAELDGPTQELTSANANHNREAERFRKEADRLYREASQRGHFPGFESYRQAVANRRKADRIQYKIDQNEIDLGYDLEPEHRLAEARVVHARALISELEATDRDLDDHARALADEAESTREAIAQLSEGIREALAAIEDRTTNELAPLYEEAAGELDQARDHAKRAATAARGSQANSGRLAATRVLALQGQLHWAHAQGMADHLRLLGRLAAAPSDLDVVDSAQGRIEAARATYDKAIEDAKTAYNQALETTGQVSGRAVQSELESLRNNINAAISVLSNEPPEAPAAAAARGRHAPGTGAASPQELISTLSGLAQGHHPEFSDVATAIGYVYPDFSSVAERELFGLIKEAIATLAELDAAMQGAFGTSLFDVAEGLMSSEAPAGTPGIPGMPGMPGLGGMGGFGADDFPRPASIELESVSGSRGEALLTMEDGSTETLELVQADGLWYFRLPESVQEQMSGGGDMAMMMQMVKPMAGQILGIVRQLTTRVRGGEFVTVAEFNTALDVEMQTFMEGFFGSMMEGGMPPGMPPGMGDRNR